jgi:hypothetical protein
LKERLFGCAERFDADQQELKPEPTIESLGFRPKSTTAAAAAAATTAGEADGEAAKSAQEQQAEDGEEEPTSSQGDGSRDGEEKDDEEERELQEDMERLFAAEKDMEPSASGREGRLGSTMLQVGGRLLGRRCCCGLVLIEVFMVLTL